MRAQFASLGARIDASVSNMAVSVAQLGGKIDAGLGEVKGSVDGLKSSVTTMQWFIASAVAIGGIWLAYLQLRHAEAPTQTQSQPAPWSTP